MHYLGYLGIVPIAMGSFWIYQWFYPVGGSDRMTLQHRPGAAIVATFLTLLSNSTDTLLAQTVVFADTVARLDWLIAVSVFLIATLLATAALYGVSNPRLGPAIERYAGRVAPFIMIAVGLYVLANTATDVMQ